MNFVTLTLPQDEVYGSNLRKSQRRPDSFAEQQVRFAKSELDNCIDTGMNPFQATQGIIFATCVIEVF